MNKIHPIPPTFHDSQCPIIRASRFFEINVEPRDIENRRRDIKASGHRTKEEAEFRTWPSTARTDVILLGQRVVVDSYRGIPATFIRQWNKLQLSPGPGALMIPTSCNSVILLDARPRGFARSRFPACRLWERPRLEMDRTRYLIIGYGADVSTPRIARTVPQSRFRYVSTRLVRRFHVCDFHLEFNSSRILEEILYWLEETYYYSITLYVIIIICVILFHLVSQEIKVQTYRRRPIKLTIIIIMQNFIILLYDGIIVTTIR